LRKVFLLEDDRSLGLTLQERLHREGFDVTLATSLSEGRALLDKTFDLYILDVGLPDGSGFEFSDEIRKRKTAPFLFMTAQSDAESRLRGYEAGATEFIPKPFHLREFLIRVTHVLENHSPSKKIDESWILPLSELDEVDFDSFQVKVNSTLSSLTQKEAQVLKVLVKSSPKVVSRDELLNQVWGEESFPTQRTVDNVILKLRQILGEEHGQKIQSVRGVGYRWNGEKMEIK